MEVTHFLAEANKLSSPTGKCDVIDSSTEGRALKGGAESQMYFLAGLKQPSLDHSLLYCLSFEIDFFIKTLIRNGCRRPNWRYRALNYCYAER